MDDTKKCICCVCDQEIDSDTVCWQLELVKPKYLLNKEIVIPSEKATLYTHCRCIHKLLLGK